MPGFGQVLYDTTVSPTNITLSGANAVRLPPSGTEFDTVLAAGPLNFDDNGGSVATLRYTGTAAAMVMLRASFSVQRVQGATNQSLRAWFAAGASPLTAANVIENTQQDVSLTFDDETSTLGVFATLSLSPNDLIQVWVRRTDTSADDDLIFQVTGYSLCASVMDPPKSHANLILDTGVAVSGISVAGSAVVKLPPAGQFSTALRNATTDFIESSEGSLKYIGTTAKTCLITATVALDVAVTLNFGLQIALNVSSAPASGTRDLATLAATALGLTSMQAPYAVCGVFVLQPNDFIELWISRVASAVSATVTVQGYSISVVEI